jgi:aryl-alcohol dehydrogenase-like predicted oxidoreductase
VHYIACSNFRAYQLCQALWTSDKLGLNKFVALQPLYNIMNRDIEVEVLPLCRDQGLGVVSYSPLARGILSGKYKAGEAFPEESRAARADKRMQQTELREASLVAAEELNAYCQERGKTLSQFALAWCLGNPLVTSIILGPRTMEQLEDNLGCLDLTVSKEDEIFVNSVVPTGEHSGKGYQDPAYPVTGRPA